MNVSLLAIARHLARRGVEVELLTRASGTPAIVEVSDGVTVRELAAGPPAPLPKADLADVTDEFGEAVARRARASAARYDLIHAHYWLSGIATLPVALELGVPFVQSFHTLAAMKNATLSPGQHPEPERRLRSEMFLANQANAVVANSAAEVTSLIDDSRAPADRIWVIPPGVDIELFDPARAERADGRIRAAFGIATERPIVAVVARIQPLKDQELAIRTLAELHSLRGWAPVLVIAGAEGPDEREYSSSLRALAAELGVASDVRFVGALSRQDTADLLAVASVTLVPSHSETFGLVALESAASGTPAVGYSGTGLAESVSDGVSGVLVDSRDPREWARIIAGLQADPAALRRLSASARHHALACTWAASATALLGVYGSLIG
jgi:D-inositol-3-phosphate glycosyltransferase